MKFSFAHINDIKVSQQIGKVKELLGLVNMELAKKSYRDAIYARRVREFNHAMIELTKAKWYTAQAAETGSKEFWDRAFTGFKRCLNTCLAEIEVRGRTK